MNEPCESPPVLSAASLGRRAENATWLLRGIDLDVRGGDRIALVGPSGSGKSLLLRALARLDPLDEGTVRFRGTSGADVPEFRSRVMYLHQRTPFGEGTVQTALLRPFEWRSHVTKTFDRDRIVEWLTEIGRGAEFLDRLLKNLSVGESQIAALLRAMQLDPELLLLDEPTSGLDPDSKRLVETLIAGWLRDDALGRAFVWVTHDPQQAARVAAKTWEMDHGRLVIAEAKT